MPRDLWTRESTATVVPQTPAAVVAAVAAAARVVLALPTLIQANLREVEVAVTRMARSAVTTATTKAALLERRL